MKNIKLVKMIADVISQIKIIENEAQLDGMRGKIGHVVNLLQDEDPIEIFIFYKILGNALIYNNAAFLDFRENDYRVAYDPWFPIASSLFLSGAAAEESLEYQVYTFHLLCMPGVSLLSNFLNVDAHKEEAKITMSYSEDDEITLKIANRFRNDLAKLINENFPLFVELVVSEVIERPHNKDELNKRVNSFLGQENIMSRVSDYLRDRKKVFRDFTPLPDDLISLIEEHVDRSYLFNKQMKEEKSAATLFGSRSMNELETGEVFLKKI